MTRIKVNLEKKTGDLKHGGIGFLYGLGNDGICNKNVLIPLKPQVIAQKPPLGKQHPNGDAFEVAEMFKQAGGKEIQIYLQDIYPDWPYKKPEINSYLDKIAEIVNLAQQHPQRKLFSYIPFNEPDAIWYNLEDKKEEFFKHWELAYKRIRAVDSEAMIVGPNNTKYNQEFYENFLYYAKKTDTIPDVLTWHELETPFYKNWYKNYESYRKIEKKLGISPREIVINEYGDFMDLSVPGQLIQWLARFEDSKVDACLAYWHDAGSLNDLVIENNKVTGAWWLYKWYSDMSGETLEVTGRANDRPGIQAIANLNDNSQELRVLLGGVKDKAELVISGFDKSDYFNDMLELKIMATEWTGHKGISRGPKIKLKGNFSIVDNKVTLDIADLDSATAYNLIITPTKETETYQQLAEWEKTYQAKAAKLNNVKVYNGGYFDGDKLYKPRNNYVSNGQYLGGINKKDSKVEFDIKVPESGKYLLDIFYSNGHRDIAEQLFRVDDKQWEKIEYKPTIAWKYEARKSLELELEAGNHKITFAKEDDSIKANLSVDIDKIDLSYLAQKTKEDIDNSPYFEEYQSKQTKGYVINTQQAAYYNLEFEQDIVGNLRVNTLDLEEFSLKENNITLFLQAGINLISFNEDLALREVIKAKDKKRLASYQAEDKVNNLTGNVEVKESKFASTNYYVTGIANGAKNSLTFNGINVAKTAKYKLLIHYANAEILSGHEYNVDIVDRAAWININDEQEMKVYFRNTFAWNNYCTTAVDIELMAGDNSITFYNDNSSVPYIDKIEIYKIQA